MTGQADKKSLDRLSKENRWYYKTIENHIPPSSRKLLEEYSHIPAEDVDSHIYKMRDILWSHAPYPCVGEFRFLTFNLTKHPLYNHILSLLQPAPPTEISPPPGPKILDLGCCVAQELRSLAHAGIPSRNLYGTDLVPSYLTTSYELFNDAGSFAGTLVPANIFSKPLFENEFKGWEGMFRVVHAGLFLHLFTWDQQVVVCRRVVKLLEKTNGAMFIGEMVGCKSSAAKDEDEETKFWKKGLERKQFLHDEDSFAKMWKEVAEKTGTKGMWTVKANFKLRQKKVEEAGDSGNASHERSFFVGEGIGWITFSVEFVSTS